MKALSIVLCGFFLLLLSPMDTISNCHASAADFEKGNPEDWKEWNQSIQDYMDMFKLVQEQGRITAMTANKGLDDAAKKADKKLHDQIIVETDVRLSVIIKELKSMDVPADLKGFHNSITDAYTSRKKAGEAALKDDYKSSSKYGEMALLSEIQAMEEMRKAALVNGAPRYVLDEMDASLVEYRKYLSVKDKTGPA